MKIKGDGKFLGAWKGNRSPQVEILLRSCKILQDLVRIL